MKRNYFLLLWFVLLVLFSSKSIAQFVEPQVPVLATEGDVLIFVSFSMPKKSLQQWFEQAKKIHAPLVLRGLVNDSLQDTQARLAQFISSNDESEEDTGITIDSRLFSEYGIKRVPAVVVRDTHQACLDEAICEHIYPFDVIYGDVGLDNALKKIADQSNGNISRVDQDLLDTGQGRIDFLHNLLQRVDLFVDVKRRTAVYMQVHEDSSIASAKKAAVVASYARSLI